jgi:antitoxin YefM
MKEVPLYDAKNALSALVQEVERSGVEIVITRHGKPAAKLSPLDALSAVAQSAALARLRALRDETARRGCAAEPVAWETLKRWMRDEDDER